MHILHDNDELSLLFLLLLLQTHHPSPFRLGRSKPFLLHKQLSHHRLPTPQRVRASSQSCLLWGVILALSTLWLQLLAIAVSMSYVQPHPYFYL
jgi:hypothetical protein